MRKKTKVSRSSDDRIELVAAALGAVISNDIGKVERMAAALDAVIGHDLGLPHVTLALDSIMRNHLRMATHLEAAGVQRRNPEEIKWH